MTSTNNNRKKNMASVKKTKHGSSVTETKAPPIYQTRLLAYRHNLDSMKARISFMEKIKRKLSPRANYAFKELNKLKKEISPKDNRNKSFIREKIDNQQIYDNLKSSKINKGIESRQKFIYYFKSLQINFVPLAMVYFTIALSNGNFFLKIPRYLQARLKDADCNLLTLSNHHIYRIINDPLSTVIVQDFQLNGKPGKIANNILVKLKKVWSRFIKVYNDKHSKQNGRIDVKELAFLQSSIKEVHSNRGIGSKNQKRVLKGVAESNKYTERKDSESSNTQRMMTVLESYKYNVLDYFD